MRHTLIIPVSLALLALVSAMGARPAGASGCPTLKVMMSVSSVSALPPGSPVPSGGGLGVGQCATLQLVVVDASGIAFITHDVTSDPNTHFSADPPQASDLSGNVFCATTAECNRTFPIYGTYHDPCTGTDLTASVQIHVAACPPPPLSITCPAAITGIPNEAGRCGAPVSFASPAVSGGTPPIQVVCSPASGSFFPVGTTPVTCTATDAAGNTAHCSFNVTVQNVQGPTITCPAGITLQAASGASAAAVALGSPSVTDPCSGVTVTGVRSDFQSLGALFPLGTTTVTWTATDASGNTVSCRQSVTITAPAPVVTAPAVTLSRSSIAFGPQAVGSSSPPQTFTITDSGTALLAIHGITITGANPGDFVVTPTGSTVLSPGMSFPFSVVFTPQGSGPRSATLLISTNASPTPFVVQLSGTGGPVVQPSISVGQPVASNLRLEIFGVDVLNLNSSASAIFHVGSDGSVYLRDYAGTALIRLPPGGAAGQVLLDTTHQDNPSLGDHTDGVGLARLLQAQANADDVIAVVALRADNTLGVYHLDKNGRLLQLGVLPDAGSPAPLAMSDHDQVAFVAANTAGGLTLFQTVNGQPNPIVSVGQTVTGGTVVGFRDAATGPNGDLSANAAGDLAFRVILRQADGTLAPAVLRKTSAGLALVASAGQAVTTGRGAGATGALTALLQPLIGPDDTVVFAGAGTGFANFFAARPGQPLQPLLAGLNWNPDPATFSYDLAADGSVALLAAPAGSSTPSLFLITPAGDVSLIAGGRRDIQPLGRPAFVPGGTGSPVFFLAENLDFPLDRNSRPLVGLYRARLVNGSPVLEPVAVPGQSVPHLPGLPPTTTPVLLSLTQRPVVTASTVTLGLLYGGEDQSSMLAALDYLRTLPVPTAVLFQVPLLGTLADGQPVAPEGAAVAGTGALAQLRSLSFRADHTLDTLALLPGAGPVIVPAAAPASTAGVARTQAAPQPTIQPLLATGDALGLGAAETLEYVLPPLLPLGANEQLFVARFQQAGGGREGYFTLGSGGQHVQPVQAPIAVTSMAATADTLFNHFSYAATSPQPDLNILDPPSIFSDGSSLNVAFKALLNGKPGTSLMANVLSGVFRWNGANALDAAALSTGTPPLTLEHWAAGKAGVVYVQARDASRSHLYRSAAPGAPLQLVTATEALADLSNFVVASDGVTLYVDGKDPSGAVGLFRVDAAQNRALPLLTTGGKVLQGQPVPPALDGSNVTGLTFSGDFTLDPALARGSLYFYATLQAGGVPSKRSLFLLDPSGQSASLLLVANLAESSARNITAIAFPPKGAVSNTRGTLAYPYQIGGHWAIGRMRNGVTEVIAQEGAAGIAVLDASLLLSTPDLPVPPGPVFALGDDDAIAFLASDGKRWGVYRAP